MINESAPAVSRSELDIAAPPAAVWAVLTDFDAWPDWSPGVKSAKLLGPVARDGRFHWKAGPMTIRSTFIEVDAPRKIAWRGRTPGVRAVHVFTLTPSNRGTLVRSEESWQGVLVRLMKRRMQAALDTALSGGLQALADEVARRQS